MHSIFSLHNAATHNKMLYITFLFVSLCNGMELPEADEIKAIIFDALTETSDEAKALPIPSEVDIPMGHCSNFKAYSLKLPTINIESAPGQTNNIQGTVLSIRNAGITVSAQCQVCMKTLLFTPCVTAEAIIALRNVNLDFMLQLKLYGKNVYSNVPSCFFSGDVDIVKVEGKDTLGAFTGSVIDALKDQLEEFAETTSKEEVCKMLSQTLKQQIAKLNNK